MYKGKAIYNPTGKAAEYSIWACNFYVGCSNECEYCYLKKGIASMVLGGNKPYLKKCFRNSNDAIKVFKNEVRENIESLRDNGLFFSFTTDPLLEETRVLTLKAIDVCQDYKVPVKVLTKRSDFFEYFDMWGQCDWDLSLIALGFTLTGCDYLEKKASSNAERIGAMHKAKVLGYKTFASIEPVIDVEASKVMIKASLPYCDLYKIGLKSGGKYDIVEIQSFVEWLDELQGPKIYLKESIQKISRYTNEEFDDYFVNSDYNMFK